MTPGARIGAAIDILDRIGQGVPAEKALTGWARQSRFAGSSDRRAIRDHVYQTLRCRRSYEWLGGGRDGRALMIGQARACGWNLAELFSGHGHAPPPLKTNEVQFRDLSDAPRAVRLDCPDWLLPHVEASTGNTEEVLEALRSRAPTFLRCNLSRASRQDVIAMLAEERIAANEHPLASSALEVTDGASRISSSKVFLSGYVELQDAASQAVVEALGIRSGDRVLDYCAGAGGKALAMADLSRAEVVAHDIDARRMSDIPARAARSGAIIKCVGERVEITGTFDTVLCDVPCSGSGSWRRDPEGKWRLDQPRLDELSDIQPKILSEAAEFVAEGGQLAYATCSLLEQENAASVARFLDEHQDWILFDEAHFSPLDGGDGFYIARLTRHKTA